MRWTKAFREPHGADQPRWKAVPAVLICCVGRGLGAWLFVHMASDDLKHPSRDGPFFSIDHSSHYGFFPAVTLVAVGCYTVLIDVLKIPWRDALMNQLKYVMYAGLPLGKL